MRLIPSFATKKTIDPNNPTEGQTLDALMAKQKNLLSQAQPVPDKIASPWQGASLLANNFVNSLQQQRVADQETAGREQLARAMMMRDPATGDITPEGQAIMMKLDPEVGYKFIADSIANRRELAKPLSDQAKLTADLRAGRISQEDYALAMGGGPAKLSDIGSLRDDYVKAAGTYDSAAPTFESMKQSAQVALNPSADVAGKGAADYDMIVGWAKLLDPNSVVREGEVQSASMTGGMIGQINGMLNRIKSQGSLDDDTRRAIMTQANTRMSAYHQAVTQKRDWLSGVATRNRMRPEDVVAPLGEFQPWGEQSAQQAEPVPDDPKLLVPGKTYKDSSGTVRRFNGGDPFDTKSWTSVGGG
jgi:hypothetical protein